MSASELFSDILHGEFSSAYHRFMDWYKSWPPELRAFVSKLTDDEGKILWAAAIAGISGAETGKSIEEIGDLIWEQIKDQVPSKAKGDLLDALGLLFRASAPQTAAT